MSEWLDIMLGEIARKKEEEAAAHDETLRRAEVASEGDNPKADSD